MEIINIENLSFSYYSKKILDDISLKIEDSKLIGIVGPNGCGKSTLLKNITKYLIGKYKSLTILGKEIEDMSAKERAQNIAFVSQNPTIIPDVPVFDFVLIGRMPQLKNYWSSYSDEDRRIVNETLKFLKIEDFSERIIGTLSGGELQKVFLAKTLVQETGILLLDEPTSALDINNAVEFMYILKKNIYRKKLSGIVVLHDLNLASSYCDEIIMMKDTKIVATGTPYELITKDNIKKIYNMDSEIIHINNKTPYIVPIIKEVIR